MEVLNKMVSEALQILKAQEKLERTQLKSEKFREAKRKTARIKLSKKAFGKPKAKIQKLSAERTILKDKGNYAMVSEGETGTFKSELMEEARWLS